ncbi:hypothetical protein ALI144C_28255 [Actinosynnema sp. ALI-1.44]|uniref:hypothetical protein n=1 Tax=Actinosynnema sp. ALI-1.44 TaxID=1933779 RepID=UPI00097BB66B|nr:hypothetical protein [Actinosynnema sp. ALI-1.44]ONI78692.1 hypothetical protein ALI144C_28255 [Actinosynnema sp. ALI-1.44]
MSPKDDVTRAVLTALNKVDGLRPSTPSTTPVASWVPWDWDTLAVEVSEDVVRVQVVATRLPLPALLGKANAVIRPVLVATDWASARLEIVVTDVDRAAFKRDSRHSSGP